MLGFWGEICRRHALHLEPLTPEICHQAELLPPHHEDPFDRMILAAAVLSGVPIFTTDPKFRAYPVRLLPQR